MRRNHTIKTTTLAIAAAMAVAGPAHAQEAVQWRVEDGGNGHWYQRLSGGLTWPQARSLAIERGGDLASLETPGERDWCRARFTGLLLLGGIQQQPASSPSENWEWLTGLPIEGPLDCDDAPCGCCSGENGQQDYLHFGGGASNVFGDVGLSSSACPDYMPALIEYSADCNGDGIVDYGQILDGTLEDANGNGVPDTCECFADVNQDGVVNGADISAVLGFWGQAGKPLPAADITRDGLVDGADLAVLLGSWGPCQ